MRSEPALNAAGELELDRYAMSRRHAEVRAVGALAGEAPYLLGVHGYALTVPGLQPDQSPYSSPFRVIAIAGTSDVYDDRRFNDAAYVYAEAFNRVILEETAKQQ